MSQKSFEDQSGPGEDGERESYGTGRDRRLARPVTPYLVTVEEAGNRRGFGRTRAYRLINSGLLFSVKVGKSRRVPVQSIEDLVLRLIAEPNLLVRF